MRRREEASRGAAPRAAAVVAGLAFFATVPILVPVPLAAQDAEGCYAAEGTETFVRRGPLSYWGRPHFECDDGVEIWADSAVVNSDLGMSLLIGTVRYLDRSREMRADTARYFSDVGRLQAYGSVFLRNQDDGSQVENGELLYFRQTDFRDTESMTVETWRDGVRPRALVRPAPGDSAVADASPPEPYEVVGDRIELRGTGYFKAVGTVEIVQDSLRAFADSAEYDEADDLLLLDGSARVVSRETELVGRTVRVEAPASDTTRIRAVHEAVLIGDGLLMTAPQIVVFLADGGAERLVAMPIRFDGDADVEPDSAALARPVATLEEAELTADSLDVVAPGERVERVLAIGNARSESTAQDSLNTTSLPEIARTDWLEGDTVVVRFGTPGEELEASEVDGVDVAVDSSGTTDPPVVERADAVPLAALDASADSPPRYEVRSITAIGRARALYRLPAADSTARAGVDPPALHYVVGTRIDITMAQGDVDAMTVVGQTRGLHLEPLQRRAAVPDSAAADSAAVPGDTLGVRTDTTVADSNVARGAPHDVGGEEALGTRLRRAPRPADDIPSETERPTPKEERPWTRP